MRLRSVSALVCAAALGLAVPLAEAALSVSPSRVVLRGKPGQKLTGMFDARNNGSTPLEVLVEPEDWAGGAYGARGQVSWLQVKPEKFTLKPGRTQQVKYAVRVPPGAQGELRTQVFFSCAVEGAGNSMRSRLGSILYLTIAGTQRLEAAIETVTVDYAAATPGVAQPDHLEIVLQVHNLSNVHIVPEGEALVKDAQGLVVATVPLPAGWGLLPGERDKYRLAGHGVYLKPGSYTLVLNLQCGADVQQPTTFQKTLPLTITPEYHAVLAPAS